MASRLGWKGTEFIAFGIRHDDPPHVLLRIADLAEHTGTQPLEALQFGSIEHVNIQMHPVLHAYGSGTLVNQMRRPPAGAWMAMEGSWGASGEGEANVYPSTAAQKWATRSGSAQSKQISLR